MIISNDDMKILLKAQQGELDAVLMYNALANVVKNKMMPKYSASLLPRRDTTPLYSEILQIKRKSRKKLLLQLSHFFIK